jgi:hypothetical protein
MCGELLDNLQSQDDESRPGGKGIGKKPRRDNRRIPIPSTSLSQQLRWPVKTT